MEDLIGAQIKIIYKPPLFHISHIDVLMIEKFKTNCFISFIIVESKYVLTFDTVSEHFKCNHITVNNLGNFSFIILYLKGKETKS